MIPILSLAATVGCVILWLFALRQRFSRATAESGPERKTYPEPTDEELFAVPELALRGMPEEDFNKIGSVNEFLRLVRRHAWEKIQEKRRKEQAGP